MRVLRRAAVACCYYHGMFAETKATALSPTVIFPYPSATSELDNRRVDHSESYKPGNLFSASNGKDGSDATTNRGAGTYDNSAMPDTNNPAMSNAHTVLYVQTNLDQGNDTTNVRNPSRKQILQENRNHPKQVKQLERKVFYHNRFAKQTKEDSHRSREYASELPYNQQTWHWTPSPSLAPGKAPSKTVASAGTTSRSATLATTDSSPLPQPSSITTEYTTSVHGSEPSSNPTPTRVAQFRYRASPTVPTALLVESPQPTKQDSSRFSSLFSAAAVSPASAMSPSPIVGTVEPSLVVPLEYTICYHGIDGTNVQEEDIDEVLSWTNAYLQQYFRSTLWNFESLATHSTSYQFNKCIYYTSKATFDSYGDYYIPKSNQLLNLLVVIVEDHQDYLEQLKAELPKANVFRECSKVTLLDTTTMSTPGAAKNRDESSSDETGGMITFTSILTILAGITVVVLVVGVYFLCKGSNSHSQEQEKIGCSGTIFGSRISCNHNGILDSVSLADDSLDNTSYTTRTPPRPKVIQDYDQAVYCSIRNQMSEMTQRVAPPLPTHFEQDENDCYDDEVAEMTRSPSFRMAGTSISNNEDSSHSRGETTVSNHSRDPPGIKVVNEDGNTSYVLAASMDSIRGTRQDNGKTLSSKDRLENGTPTVAVSGRSRASSYSRQSQQFLENDSDKSNKNLQELNCSIDQQNNPTSRSTSSDVVSAGTERSSTHSKSQMDSRREGQQEVIWPSLQDRMEALKIFASLSWSSSSSSSENPFSPKPIHHSNGRSHHAKGLSPIQASKYNRETTDERLQENKGTRGHQHACSNAQPPQRSTYEKVNDSAPAQEVSPKHSLVSTPDDDDASNNAQSTPGSGPQISAGAATQVEANPLFRSARAMWERLAEASGTNSTTAPSSKTGIRAGSTPNVTRSAERSTKQSMYTIPVVNNGARDRVDNRLGIAEIKSFTKSASSTIDSTGNKEFSTAAMNDESSNSSVTGSSSGFTTGSGSSESGQEAAFVPSCVQRIVLRKSNTSKVEPEQEVHLNCQTAS
ncbi:hypothetical protein ACA910_022707 [Epithemia clementina (nom. ined.)]